jgi:hypothetical protein
METGKCRPAKNRGAIKPKESVMKKALAVALVVLMAAFLAGLPACGEGDSDNDGMPDSYETLHGCLGGNTADAMADPDGDGLPNILEYLSESNNYYAIDPCNFDTDGDGLGDGAELGVVVGPGPDGVLDTSPAEGDSLWTGYVIYLGDNHQADTDADPESDDIQVLPLNGHTVIVTDPTKWDTDGDMLPDQFELDNSYGHAEGQDLDPTDPDDAALNFDSGYWPDDHNSNRNEYWNGTDPWDPDPTPADFAQNIGCYYWADTDGDGIMGPADRLKVVAEIVSPQTFSNILPQNHDPIDVDRDGCVGPGDLVLWDEMFIGTERAGGYNSTPASLDVVDAPAESVANGSTTHVTVSVGSQGGYEPYSPGLGVVFQVVSGDAVLLGGDGTDYYTEGTNRYDISMEAAGGALANIVVLISPENVDPVTVTASIPGCGTYPYGRWSYGVDAVEVEIQW